MKRLALLIFLFSLWSLPLWAAPMDKKDLPEPLQSWVPWVLHGVEDQLHCPPLYNSDKNRECGWPSRLDLIVDEKNGAFRQEWLMFSEGWIILPGNIRNWPQDVKINEEPARVVNRNGMPGIHVGPGSYELEGSFTWESLPEFIQISPTTALISLSVNNRAILIPDIDPKGRVWLQKQDRDKKGEEARLEISVFRRFTDEIPMMQTLHIELDVSGKPREILLGQGLPKGTLPMSLDSALPARIEPDGRLRVQVRPGTWNIVLTCRYPGPVETVKLDPANGQWPQEEVWSFDARNQLRLVEIEGGTPIDPQQTAMPNEWRTLPAFRIKTEEALLFKEKRRGDPDPAPDQLSLSRNIWLDFSGRGYTIQDQIHGTMTRGWRLEMSPPAELGQVTVDGKGQVITRQAGSKKSGVEVRRGQIELIADSRIKEKQTLLPAVGWDHDFQQVSAVLHLPPGWRLFSATGADDVPGTWLKKWTLLDLFVVLIISISISRLWGLRWGLVALAALTLCYQEFLSPRFVWIHILFAVALLRVLPTGRFSRIIRLYRNLSLMALVIISLPFMVDQVRKGIFPQLERPWQAITPSMAPGKAGLMEEDRIQPMEDMPAEPERLKSELYESKDKISRLYRGRIRSLQYDPKANIQTGPGLPLWEWTAMPLRWNGPVDHTQAVRLVLIPPFVNLVLSFFRVFLLALLIFCVLDIRFRKGEDGFQFPFKGPSQTAALFLIILCSFLMPPSAQAEFPSKELLDELRERLLEKSDCFPRCADSPRMEIEINQDTLRARIEIHSLELSAVPLPGSAEQWLPNRILLNDIPAPGLFKTGQGQIWIELKEGQHHILMEGPLPNRSTVQLALPLKPHRVDVKLQGWTVEGLHENGLADNNLQFTRVIEETEEQTLSTLETGTLPPFVRVERTLFLGLDWEIHTQLLRLTPADTAVVVEVPLLNGESVISEHIREVDGKALINMPPNTTHVDWTSVFEKMDQVTLTAPETTSWTEVWRVDVSPIWHVNISGIPVVHHQSQSRWLPTFRPWPGESITIHITRPEGVPGKTFTIDRTQIVVTPGQRATSTTLTLNIRSSQGGQHTLKLPTEARLQSVSINGVEQSIRQEGNRVTLPLIPGSQSMALQFQQSSGISQSYRTPGIELGVESVNAMIDITVPRNRWILFTNGPDLGPAVLFWGVLLVVILLSMALGRVKATPLRTQHWLLLGLGLSAASVYTAIVVAAWFFVVGWRKNFGDDEKLDYKVFNLTQIGIGALTIMALSSLLFAIQQGLLGYPDMQIAGNGSTAFMLRWYMDRADLVLPQAWILTVPMLIYRLLMLAWALWLAFALLRWLRWAWECYSTNGIWRTGKIIRPGKASNPSHTIVPPEDR